MGLVSDVDPVDAAIEVRAHEVVKDEDCGANVVVLDEVLIGYDFSACSLEGPVRVDVSRVELEHYILRV